MEPIVMPPSAANVTLATLHTELARLRAENTSLAAALERAHAERRDALAEASVYRERWALLVQIEADLHDAVTLPVSLPTGLACPFESPLEGRP